MDLQISPAGVHRPLPYTARTFIFIVPILCTPVIRAFTGIRSGFGRTTCRPKSLPVAIHAGPVEPNRGRWLDNLLPLDTCGLKLLSDFRSIMQQSLQLRCTASTYVNQVKTMMFPCWRPPSALDVANIPNNHTLTSSKQRAVHERNRGTCMPVNIDVKQHTVNTRSAQHGHVDTLPKTPQGVCKRAHSSSPICTPKL